ncbi:hypothetical protein [Niastella populi]|uniref:Uncharacterized protein n=1 Tax=Niastella populi TaxID=550983 RepID=A0A1V9GA76_9BACT|nr:hypothetical protein [Niastella populi]OQP67559.1 hypothetical protein A4R26_12135 [Niastella populi]
MTTSKVTIKKQVWDLALTGMALLLVAFVINLKFVYEWVFKDSFNLELQPFEFNLFVFAPITALSLILAVVVVYRTIINGSSRTNKILKWLSLALCVIMLLGLLVTLIIM